MVEIRGELNRQNPWWAERSSIAQDESIRNFYSSAVKWEGGIETKKNEIVVLRGPRQVGKTTIAKRKLEELLAKKMIAPQAVCYFSCDMVSSKDELYAYVREFLDFSAVFGLKEKWLFIDEISYVPDWALAIKRLKDAGELADAHVFLTGSNSVDLKKGAERLPGRGIEGNEHFLYPLSFDGYLKVFESSFVPSAVSPFDFFRNKQVKQEAYVHFRKLEPNLHSSQLFQKFLKTGGFLKAINEFSTGGEAKKETYIRWIERDVSVLGKDLNYARQVLRSIIEKGCSPASLLGIAKATDISSHNTVKQYVSLLEDMQVISTYGCFDRSTKQVVVRKDKKYHFLDPFISSAVSSWVGAELQEQAVVEGVVAEHMRRLANQAQLEYGYYRDSGCEIDIMLKKGEALLPIEVKWQEKISSKDFKGLYKFGYGIIVSKNKLALEKEKYLVIPTALFLSLFQIESIQQLRYIHGS